MISTPESREELLRRLVKIESVTAGENEPEAAHFVYEYLSELAYFRENPAYLEMLPTPCEGDDRRLCAVAARVYANNPTNKTVVFIAHYDVVDAGAYGGLRPWAFDPDELERRLANEDISPRAREDLLSGRFIFGRGVMDMKCGLALEMELIRDFASDRGMFDVNVIVLAVPDEENGSCGMRGAASWLARLKRAEGLEYIACVDTEPSDPGLPDAPTQLIFVGSMGKLLPAFYCAGVEAHVGNYYRGMSATLLSSLVVLSAEAAPKLADPEPGLAPPSWCCLSHRTLEEGYAVTVPSRSVAYFNAYVLSKGPDEILGEMKDIADSALEEAARRLKESHGALAGMGYGPPRNDFSGARAITFSEIFERAAKNAGYEAAVRQTLLDTRGGDARDRGLALLECAIRAAVIEPPFIAVGFLPPCLPPVTSRGASAREKSLIGAVARVIRHARDRYGVEIEIAERFAGLCDLSYAGYFEAARWETLGANCPGWGDIFSVPFGDIEEISMPVVNIGPCGYDAHRKTERLERDYSLRVLPELLTFFIRSLSAEQLGFQHQS